MWINLDHSEVALIIAAIGECPTSAKLINTQRIDDEGLGLLGGLCDDYFIAPVDYRTGHSVGDLVLEAQALGLSDRASYEQRNALGTRGLSDELDDKIEALIQFRFEDGSNAPWDEGAIFEQTWSISEIDNLLNFSIEKAAMVKAAWFPPDQWTGADTFDAAVLSADFEEVDNLVLGFQTQ
jgi:hypothetical protein